MESLKVKFKNCYGIGSFEHVFDFANSNSHLIYAPNGTMKSSFARTFNDISKNDKKVVPCDRIYQDRKTICEVLSDGTAILPEKILVVDAEDNSFDASTKITNFIASKDLKKKYDEIYSELDLRKSEFIKKLKGISSSTDCEGEFINTFSTSRNTFYESLDTIINQIDQAFPKYDFKYNHVFDSKGNVQKFLEKNHSLLNEYVENYQGLISQSSFFKKSENSFGTIQANEILKSTEDNSFFEAGHKFIIDGKIEIDSFDKLKKMIDEEISKIINDAKLKEAFGKVDKSIGSNVELRAFKKVIENNNLLLVELDNYETFKEKVWLSYFSQLKSEAEELSDFYGTKKNDLQRIINEAKKETEIWKEIVSKFNSRFFVPFTVSISNQDDIILKQETANLIFHYSDRNDESVKQHKDNLLKILSKGEQRAYYILQLLFDIEARKQNNSNLIIFDDIADSFDYKNKYAIIEYIKDLHESANFKSIILTHNFDFYRTISSRLSLNKSVFMTRKNIEGKIELTNGEYRNDVFTKFSSRIEEPKTFISLLAFVRNIVEYTEGINDDYLRLTECLHLKQNSINITANDILAIYKAKIPKCVEKTITFGEQNIIELINKTSDSINSEEIINEILLQNKIVLSISIRLKAEQFMIKSLPDIKIDDEHNQTRYLFDEFRKRNFEQKSIIEILDRVILMTPENIHLNAFMYEPLIDMSINHLKTLFADVNSLN